MEMSYLFNLFTYFCSVTVASTFPPLLAPTQSPSTPTVNPPIVQAQESALCVPLFAPSPSFPCYPPPPPVLSLSFVLCFQVSGSILIICLFC